MFAGNQCTRPWFRDTFSCDNIGQERPTQGLYVLNPAPILYSGEHWVIFFFVSPKGDSIRYFDSFGMILIHQEFYDSIRNVSSFLYKKKKKKELRIQVK